MAEARVQIVDEHDQPIGGATKQEAFAKGLIRQIVRGLTEDGQGRLLLHKRAPHKKPNANLWDWLPSGHVDEGETYDQAIRRESEEELGIPNSLLVFTPIETYYTSREAEGLKLNNFSRVFKITIQPGAPAPRLDESEAVELRWFTVEELKEAVRNRPDEFAPSVHLLLPKYYTS
jgi:isopentenyl-diphosphate delta-isomerase